MKMDPIVKMLIRSLHREYYKMLEYINRSIKKQECDELLCGYKNLKSIIDKDIIKFLLL